MATIKIINSNQNYTSSSSIVKEIAVFQAISLFLSSSAGDNIVLHYFLYQVWDWVITASLMRIAKNMLVNIMMRSFDSGKETIDCKHSVSK